MTGRKTPWRTSAARFIGWGPSLLLCSAAVHAAALTDGSTGAVQSLSGAFTVPQALGTVRGANLFHSFTRFGIAPGESATFSTSDAGIRHVISRVTGGEASTLQGPLRLQAAGGSQPDFWLVNPSGITVGAGARFDVPAGLHLSTAQQLRFADGVAWDARNATASSLSVATPDSFGFLGGQAAAALQWRDAQSELPSGSRLTIAAGDVTLQGAVLSVPEGHLSITAAGAQATRVTPGPAETDPAASGRLSLFNAQLLTAGVGRIALVGGEVALDETLVYSGNFSAKAGELAIRARESLVLDNSQVESATSGPGAAADLSLRSSGSARLSNGSWLRSSQSIADVAARQLGRSGNIGVSVERDMTLESGSLLGTDALFTGSAGSLRVDVGGALELRRADIVSRSLGSGNAGDVTVRAASILLDGTGDWSSHEGLGQIYSEAIFGSGNAGSVTVESPGRITILGYGAISSSTSSAGSGATVTVRAGSMLIDGPREGLLDESGSPIVGGLFSEAFASSTGRAGGIDLRVAGLLEMYGLGVVSTETVSAFPAGNIQVDAGSMLIDGQGLLSGIGSRSIQGSGQAGSVSVNVAGSAQLFQGGGISTDTYTGGNGGTVQVTAGSLQIDGRGDLSVQTGIASRALLGAGNAGQVQVRIMGHLSIAHHGGISSGTSSSGAAGSVTVRAGSIDIDGSNAPPGTTAVTSSADAGSSGKAGTVSVLADTTLKMANGAVISITNDARLPEGSVQTPTTLTVNAAQLRMTRSEVTAAASANAKAGRVEVQAADSLTLSGSVIRTSAVDGDGGRVTINAGGVVRLVDSAVTTSVEGVTSGNGGDIDLNARALLLESGFIQANTNAPLARGGNVAINANTLLPNGSNVFIGGNRVEAPRTGLPGFNVIQAAAPDGVSGTLDVTLPQLNLAGSLAGLNTARIEFGLLSQNQCTAGWGSSLTRLGRGGLIPTAEQALRVQP